MKTLKKYPFIIWAGILLAQILLFRLVISSSFLVLQAERFFQAQKKLHQSLFKLFPFSVGDLFYIILMVIITILIIQLLKRKKRKNALKNILILLNLVFFSYQIFWGLLYSQKPIYDNSELKSPEVEQLKQLTFKYLDLSKEARLKVHENEKGVFQIKDLSRLKKTILSSQELPIATVPTKASTGIDSFKPSLFGKLLSFTGILGYYNPFSAEAQYNPHLPSTSLPFTLSHESAHQLGFTREQEANFVAYLIGIESSDHEIRYSTYYTTLRHLLWAVNPHDPEFVQYILREYSDKMKKDQEFEREFFSAHEGFLEQFFLWTNDLFLRSNRQEGRITYCYFVTLLATYESDYK